MQTYKPRRKKNQMRKKFEELEKEREEKIFYVYLVMIELIFLMGCLFMD